SWRPTMSPGYDMSTISFFSAKKAFGLENLRFLFNRTCKYGLFRSNVPETILINASLSRCLGSIFAWILNTNPDNFSSVGSTSRVSDSLARGDGAISTKQSSNSRTPKLFNADPKNTG